MPLPTGVMLAAMAWATMAQAAVPAFITYSGRLTDGAYAGQSATPTLTFALYGQESGGVALWTSVAQTVATEDGFFSVILGEGTGADGATVTATSVFAAHDAAWLGVTVGAGPELAPRLAIGSVPYAVRAANASAVDGQSLGSLDQRFVNASGDTVTGSLEVTDDISAKSLTAGGARLFSDGDRTFVFTGVGRSLIVQAAIGTLADRIALQGDVVTTARKLGVGVDIPQKQLDVAGDARLTGTLFAGCHAVEGPFTEDGTSVVQASVSCPSGEIATGGGVNCYPGLNHRLIEMYPTSGGAGWTAFVDRPSSTHCAVTAICCRFGN